MQFLRAATAESVQLDSQMAGDVVFVRVDRVGQQTVDADAIYSTMVLVMSIHYSIVDCSIIHYSIVHYSIVNCSIVDWSIVDVPISHENNLLAGGSELSKSSPHGLIDPVQIVGQLSLDRHVAFLNTATLLLHPLCGV